MTGRGTVYDKADIIEAFKCSLADTVKNGIKLCLVLGLDPVWCERGGQVPCGVFVPTE